MRHVEAAGSARRHSSAGHQGALASWLHVPPGVHRSRWSQPVHAEQRRRKHVSSRCPSEVFVNARTHGELAAFIWRICNLLRGPYKRNEYRKVILPLTVLADSTVRW